MALPRKLKEGLRGLFRKEKAEREMDEELREYGILKGYDVQNETYQWAQRANIVIDKNGVIQHIEEGDSAVDPNTAMSVCTDLHKKQSSK